MNFILWALGQMMQVSPKDAVAKISQWFNYAAVYWGLIACLLIGIIRLFWPQTRRVFMKTFRKDSFGNEIKEPIQQVSAQPKPQDGVGIWIAEGAENNTLIDCVGFGTNGIIIEGKGSNLINTYGISRPASSDKP